MDLSWVMGGLAVMGAVVSVTSAFASQRSQVSGVAKRESSLRTEFLGLREDARRSTDSLNRAVVMIEVLSNEVRVVNQMTEKTLSGLVLRQDSQAKQIAELSGSVSLIAELLKVKGILN